MKDVTSSIGTLREQAARVRSHWTRALETVPVPQKVPGNQWTPAQILDHITITQHQYVNSLLAAAGEAPAERAQRAPVGTLVGRSLRWSMDALSFIRLASPESFRPSAVVDNQASHERFLNDRDRLEMFLSARDLRDLASIRLVSPANSHLRLNAIDVVDVVLAHERRHLRQLDQRN